MVLNITGKDIEMTAKSIKIAVNDEEMDRLVKDFSVFFKWVEPLLQDDGAGEVKPAAYNFTACNVQEKDEAFITKDRERLTGAAENYEDGFYRVPPIIE